MYLFVAETLHDGKNPTGIEIRKQISPEELDQLNSAFRVCGSYHAITQIKDIVIENGNVFKAFMTSENLRQLGVHKVAPERVITMANKNILNYASSIKTYIDMESRLLKKRASKAAADAFATMCSHFYDTTIAYRFWVNFRNYVVHCEFPYSIYRESIEDGCRIICTRERLLQFDNWKHSRVDIEAMPDEVDLPGMVDDMSSIIYALYIDYFRYFSTEIVEGIRIYGEFCRKYDVTYPIIFKTLDPKKVEGGHYQPLPIKELQASLEMLKNNPNVEINVI